MSPLMGIVVFLFGVVVLSTSMVIWRVVKPRVLMAVVAMRVWLPRTAGVPTPTDKKTDGGSVLVQNCKYYKY